MRSGNGTSAARSSRTAASGSGRCARDRLLRRRRRCPSRATRRGRTATDRRCGSRRSPSRRAAVSRTTGSPSVPFERYRTTWCRRSDPCSRRRRDGTSSTGVERHRQQTLLAATCHPGPGCRETVAAGLSRPARRRLARLFDDVQHPATPGGRGRVDRRVEAPDLDEPAARVARRAMPAPATRASARSGTASRTTRTRLTRTPRSLRSASASGEERRA